MPCGSRRSWSLNAGAHRERRQLIGEKPPHNLASVTFLFSSLSTRLLPFLPPSLCSCLLPPPGMPFLPLPCMSQLLACFLWEVFPDSLTL